MKKITVILLLSFLCLSYTIHAQYPRYLYGVASWYGEEYDGADTASGETFDSDELTAAHKTLPFGTLVTVENVINGNTVQVRINDRGPFVEGRIIDLSEAAAEELGFIDDGTTYVKVTIDELGASEYSEESIYDTLDMGWGSGDTGNNVTTTNIITREVTNVVTNTTYIYQMRQIERDLEDYNYEGQDPNDLYVIEEPIDDPVLPVDEGESTPYRSNYLVDSSDPWDPQVTTTTTSTTIPVTTTSSTIVFTPTTVPTPTTTQPVFTTTTLSTVPFPTTTTTIPIFIPPTTTSTTLPMFTPTTVASMNEVSNVPARPPMDISPDSFILDIYTLESNQALLDASKSLGDLSEIPVETNEIPIVINNYVNITNEGSGQSSPENALADPEDWGADEVAPRIAIGPDGYSYYLQVGAFTKSANAKNLYNSLMDESYPVFTNYVEVNSTYFTRVKIGFYSTLAEVVQVKRDIKLDYSLDGDVYRVPLLIEESE